MPHARIGSIAAEEEIIAKLEEKINQLLRQRFEKKVPL